MTSDWCFRDKHSSLVQKFVNYGQISFIVQAPGAFSIKVLRSQFSFYNTGHVITIVKYDHKPFIEKDPGACTIKLFTAIIYGFCNKLEDRHSILLWKCINYDCKKFHSTGPRGLFYKSFTIVFYNHNDMAGIIKTKLWS